MKSWQLLPAPYHCTRSQLTKLSLKFFSKICILDIFFPEQNFILRIFLSRIDFFIQNRFFIFVFGFSFPKHNYFFSIFFFSGMYYFSILDFLVRNRILIFVSGFLFPKLNNYFRIYFSRIFIFNSRFLFPELRAFLEIKKICWVQVKNDWVQRAFA